MYKYQLNRLFRKNLLPVVIILVILIGGKFLTAKLFYKDEYIKGEEKEFFDFYVKKNIGLSADEKLEYINGESERIIKILSSIPEGEGRSDSLIAENNAFSKYSSLLFSNVYILNGIQKYAETGKGLVSPYIPDDFYYTKDAYTDIREPDIINDHHFMLFLTLQSYSLIPVLILLLVGIFVADSYEKRIDLQASISAKNKDFFTSQEVVLSIFAGILMIINLLSDLIISGVLAHPYELTATLNSIPVFQFVPTDIALWQMAALMFSLEAIGGFICYHLFSIVAKYSRSTKKYMVTGLSVIVLATLISTVVPNQSAYFFTGISNRKNAIFGVKYLPSIGITNLYFPLAVGIVLLAVLITFRLVKFKKVK